MRRAVTVGLDERAFGDRHLAADLDVALDPAANLEVALAANACRE